jgi:hypothetical protein
MGLPKMKPVWSYDLKEEAAFIPTLLVLGYVSLQGGDVWGWGGVVGGYAWRSSTSRSRYSGR